MDAFDYSQEKSVGPSADALKQLSELASRAADVQREKARIEGELERANEHLSLLLDKQIPELMDQVGMEQFKTSSGLAITIKEVIRASIPKARHDEAIQWLDEHNEGGMVKRRFLISFNRDEESWARKFMADLAKRKQQLRVEMERKVEPMTLKSWVTKRLASGEEFEPSLFGVFRQRQAAVTLKGQ